VAAKTTRKAMTIVYWIVTALFCLQMSFTAYADCACRRWRRRSPTSASPPTSGWSLVGQAPSGGAVAAPAPARLKEWAYAGFAIDLASALIAHVSWRWPGGVGLGGGHRSALGLSYFLWRACRPRRRAPDRDPLAV